MKPGDVFWAASDIGWVVGHSYIVYAPLLMGCTTVLYEGKPVATPDASAFWRVISEHRVNALFTAPTAIRAIKREDPAAELTGNFDLSSLRALFLAGERADPDTVAWCERALGVPVIDHWWQTETGWAIAANCMGLAPLPVKHGSPTKAVPGYVVHVLDDDGREVAPGETGHIVIKLPLPPGCLTTLWQNDAAFQSAYLDRFPGYYQTADAGHIDEDGYLWVMARTDDVINVAGHRLSTGAIEEAIAGHPDVAECAVIGVKDSLKGELPLAFLVLNAGVNPDPQALAADVVARVRERIGPVAAFKQACVVPRLPKTRSGKILRGTMRKIADSEAYRTPPTIEDPGSLEERGFGGSRGGAQAARRGARTRRRSREDGSWPLSRAQRDARGPIGLGARPLAGQLRADRNRRLRRSRPRPATASTPTPCSSSACGSGTASRIFSGSPAIAVGGILINW
jgi:propionyl-CoA synthetase